MKLGNFEFSINKIKKAEIRSNINDLNEAGFNPILGTLGFNSYSAYSEHKAMMISTVFRCVDVISNAVASLKLIPYEYKQDPENWKYVNYNNNLWNLWNIQPNDFQNAFNFKKQMMMNKLLNGNTYILIDADINWNIKNYFILDSDDIEVINLNGDIKYKNKKTGNIYDKSQIIHLFGYSDDGYTGKSILTKAYNTLDISYNSEILAKNWFRGGGNAAGILSPKAGVKLNDEQMLNAKTKFVNAVSGSDVLSDPQGNRVVVMANGMEYQGISFKPNEMQLLESRQFNAIDVCRWFGVPPSMVFDQNGKYATSEQQQIDFLNNCLQPNLELIENEVFRKSYLKKDWYLNDLMFDVENVMRLDSATRTDNFVKQFNVGAITSNEIRFKLNYDKPLKGGNEAFIQQLQMLSNPVQQQVEKVDNNLKKDMDIKNNDNENGK